MIRVLIVLLVFILILGCSQNRHSRDQTLYDEILFKTFGFLYTIPHNYKSNPIAGTIKITESDLIFEVDNPIISRNTIKHSTYVMPIISIENIRLLNDKLNDQIAFQFELSGKENMIFSSEKTEELVNLIISLKN